MNRFERRKAESIKRKVRAMKPAARELAIQTGMELHDAFAEERAEKRTAPDAQIHVRLEARTGRVEASLRMCRKGLGKHLDAAAFNL